MPGETIRARHEIREEDDVYEYVHVNRYEKESRRRHGCAADVADHVYIQ